MGAQVGMYIMKIRKIINMKGQKQRPMQITGDIEGHKNVDDSFLDVILFNFEQAVHIENSLVNKNQLVALCRSVGSRLTKFQIIRAMTG